MDYQTFCRNKHVRPSYSGFDIDIAQILTDAFQWQKRIVQWAVKRGRAALFLSTGMATFYEIEMALTVLRSKGECFLTLMHCCSQYPDLRSRPEDVFSSIQRLSHKFGYPVGYSDHTTDAECIVAAVDAGAVAVEMHFDLKDEKGAEAGHSVPASEAAEIITRLNPDWRERAWRRSPEDGLRPMPWIR